jgi:hypothetical protein
MLVYRKVSVSKMKISLTPFPQKAPGAGNPFRFLLFDMENGPFVDDLITY